MASNIRVVKEQLGVFAGKVDAESETLKGKMENNLDTMASGHASIAASGMPSGQLLLSDHGAIMQEFGQYMMDQQMGLMALSWGAQSVQINYTAADEESADGVSAVDRAFSPADGTPSMASMWEEMQDGKSEAASSEEATEIEDRLPEPTDYTPSDTSAPSPSIQGMGPGDEYSESIIHDQEQERILYGMEPGGNGSVDTGALDDDLHDEWSDGFLDQSVLNGMSRIP